MSQSVPSATDVFVVGGGPAGLAAAITARQRGFRVMVADGAQPPIDKACGEGFLPDGVEALERLGIHVPRTEAYPFRGVRFLTSSSLSAEAQFPDGGSGLAVRRTILHSVMIERAAQLGADLLWRTAVTGISQQGVHLGDRFVRARWIVGADGSNSRVRRWAGLEAGGKAPFAIRIPAALSRRALDRPHGSVLGRSLPGLCHRCEPRAGLRCAGIARSWPAVGGRPA